MSNLVGDVVGRFMGFLKLLLLALYSALLFPTLFGVLGLLVGVLISASQGLSTFMASGIYYTFHVDVPLNKFPDVMFFLGFFTGFFVSAPYAALKNILSTDSHVKDSLNEIMDDVEKTLKILEDHDKKLEGLDKEIQIISTPTPVVQQLPPPPPPQTEPTPTPQVKHPPPPEPSIRDFEPKIINMEVEELLAKADIFDEEDLMGSVKEDLILALGEKRGNALWRVVESRKPKSKQKSGNPIAYSDDLTKHVSTITPEMEAALNMEGVFTLQDLSQAKPEAIASCFGDSPSNPKKARYAVNRANELLLQKPESEANT